MSDSTHPTNTARSQVPTSPLPPAGQIDHPSRPVRRALVRHVQRCPTRLSDRRRTQRCRTPSSPPWSARSSPTWTTTRDAGACRAARTSTGSARTLPWRARPASVRTYWSTGSPAVLGLWCGCGARVPTSWRASSPSTPSTARLRPCAELRGCGRARCADNWWPGSHSLRRRGRRTRAPLATMPSQSESSSSRPAAT